MGYKLTNGTEDTLSLSAEEWEMILKLANSPVGWEPQEGKDYTRGRIDSEEASIMAESVKGMIGQASSQRAFQYPEETRHTRQELREDLGYEEEPLKFFGSPQQRYIAQGFFRLASAGAFEVVPDSNNPG